MSLFLIMSVILLKCKCFQYVVTVALNDDEIKKDPQILAKIKPFYKQI